MGPPMAAWGVHFLARSVEVPAAPRVHGGGRLCGSRLPKGPTNVTKGQSAAEPTVPLYQKKDPSAQ